MNSFNLMTCGLWNQDGPSFRAGSDFVNVYEQERDREKIVHSLSPLEDNVKEWLPQNSWRKAFAKEEEILQIFLSLLRAQSLHLQDSFQEDTPSQTLMIPLIPLKYPQDTSEFDFDKDFTLEARHCLLETILNCSTDQQIKSSTSISK